MKILHISDQPPGYISGGQLGILEFSYVWTRIGSEVDYVGPEIEDNEIAGWYHKTFYLNDQLTKIQKVISLVHLQFDRKYISWSRRSFNFNDYDLIYIDFTKMDYVLRKIRKSRYSGRVIVRAHNVEADFFKVNFTTKKTWMNFLKYIVAKPRERYMVENSDVILAITEEDKKRLLELYNVNNDRIVICPVGVNVPSDNIKIKCIISNKIKCLITGSLWFGPNSEATLWFIINVFPDVKDICDVTVAGFKPREEIKEQCDKNGIRLIDSPESMQPYFEESEMVLAPIFDGGGMKVKIAEAMSYGLPIVTTSHGAIGYKIQNGVNGYIADTAQDFIKAIRSYYEMSEGQRKKFLESEWQLYTENYSVLAIRDFCKNMIEDLI